MVINSLFLISSSDSKIFMEKHWCSAVHRSAMDEFLKKLKEVPDINDMPIVMAGSNDHYFIHIYFADLIFCAICREGTFMQKSTEYH